MATTSNAAIARNATQPPDNQVDIGAEIKMLRKAKRLTLMEVADMVRVSASYLSRIERNACNPSLNVLQDIARALGVTVGWFFHAGSNPYAEVDRYVVRADARRRLELDAGVTEELLSPRLDGELQLLHVRFAPGAGGSDGPRTHTGEEAGCVLSGILEVTIGKETYTLGAGDSYHFSSEIPHRYYNPGTTDTVVVHALTPPLL